VSEAAFSRALVAALRKGGAKVQRVEDKLSEGIPDINIAFAGEETWIELKEIKWPQREDTPIKIPLRRQQVRWIRERTEVGRIIFIAARESRTKEVLLFTGLNVLGKDLYPLTLPRKALIDAAAFIGTTHDVVTVILEALSLSSEANIKGEKDGI